MRNPRGLTVGGRVMANRLVLLALTLGCIASFVAVVLVA